MKKIQLLGSLIVLFIFTGTSWAHEGEKHENSDTRSMKITLPPEQLKLINQRYIKEIKPIFENKCFVCHGSGKKLPWYASIPGPKQLIQWDIREAKKHLDMSKDFPFISHETPMKDLKEMIEISEEGDMPPLRYLLMHWDGKLTDQENRLLRDWARDGLERLPPEPESSTQQSK